MDLNNESSDSMSFQLSNYFCSTTTMNEVKILNNEPFPYKALFY